jgi:Asp-tRNA(Asn)/Glu-tRNA(Gln) amidotransferase A subunit family amidase
MRLPRVLKWLHWAYTKYILRDHVWAALLEHWHEKSAAEQWTWVAKREAYKLQWHEWWNSFGEKGNGMDFLLTPPNALPAVPHGAMSTAAASCGYTFLFNLLDYSAGIVPVTHVDAEKDGLGKEVDVRRMNGVAKGAYRYYDADEMHGLPVAVQLVGRRLEEEKVLAGMKVLEDALEKRGERYELLNDGAEW